MVAQDPKSAEIIKPVLRGRDIQRYQAQWAGLWLIDTHNGYREVPPINVDEFEAVKRHLDKFYPQLAKRQDKGRTPYNLRNCAYHEEFNYEKIVWIELVDRGRFAYDNSGIFCEATTFFMTGKCVKYLCAILNSKLIHWFLQQVAPTSGLGTLRWKKVYVESIPVPEISGVAMKSLIQPMNKILSAKSSHRDVDVSELEEEINQKVHQLYKLTPTEIKSIEDAVG